MILDLAALRTFVTAIDLNGFGKAAERLHRTPGAVSQQLKALEQRIGAPLFRKDGRQQTLTETGETLLTYARRLLRLNDETALALRAMDISGEVRFGMPQDFAEGGLAPALARFARAHAAVRLDITVDRSAALLAQLHKGALDLTLAFGDGDASPPLARLPVRWFAQPELELKRGEPLPLIVLSTPCAFRQAAIAALDRAKRPWRIALSSGSVSAVWAAVAAGLGVTPRTSVHVPAGTEIAVAGLRLPKLAPVPLRLLRRASRPNRAADALHEVVDTVVREKLAV